MSFETGAAGAVESFDQDRFDAALAEARTPDEVKAIVENELAPRGFAYFDIVSLDVSKMSTARAASRFFLCNYLDGDPWDKLPEDYPKDDDVLKYMAERTQPVEYVGLVKGLRATPHNLLHRALLRAYGIHRAWLVPLSTVGHVQAFTAYLKGRKGIEIFNATRPAIQAIGAAAMDRMILLHQDVLTPANPIVDLTLEERACLTALAQGLSNREIGVLQGVSENTVRYHLKKIFKKLGVSSRGEATAFVTRGGLFATRDFSDQTGSMDRK